MKVLLGMRMKAVALFLFLSMGMSAGSGQNENAFSVLCDVLKHAKRLLNKTGTQSGPLKEALYGSGNRALFSREGKVTIQGTCHTRSMRNLLCTYKSGTSGCFAESVAGSLTCTLKKWNGLIQHTWIQARDKCILGSDNMESTREEDLGVLKKAIQKVMYTLKEGHKGRYHLFYLGEGMGSDGCSGRNQNDICAGYYGAGKTRDTVTIPWLDKIQKALEDLKKASPRETPPPPVSTPTLPSFSGTSPAPNTKSDVTPSTSAESKEPEVEPSETSTPTDTAEEGNTEDGHPTQTASSAHQSRPKSRSKRSTTEDPTATGTAPDDPSTSDEPEILDPTAAPLSSPDGADLLAPLGLFMAAASFF